MKEEAVVSSVSSKIEGTLASIQDVFQYEVTGNMNKDESQHLRLREVINYIRALETCLKNIRYDNKRITLEMIKKAHQILMHDVRGGDKRPGEIRTIQNWIVPYGKTMNDSIYTPPSPKLLYDLLINFENFLNNPGLLENHCPLLYHKCATLLYHLGLRQ